VAENLFERGLCLPSGTSMTEGIWTGLLRGLLDAGNRKEDSIMNYGPIKHFTDIEAWKLAKELRVAIYSIIKELPSEEKYDLASQMRWAAISWNGGHWLLCDLLKFLTPAPSAGAIPVKPVRHRSRSGPARRPPSGLRAGTAGGYAAPQLNGFQI